MSQVSLRLDPFLSVSQWCQRTDMGWESHRVDVIVTWSRQEIRRAFVAVWQLVETLSPSQATWVHSAALICISVALSQTPAGTERPWMWGGVGAPRAVPVYVPTYTCTKLYCLVMGTWMSTLPRAALWPEIELLRPIDCKSYRCPSIAPPDHSIWQHSITMSTVSIQTTAIHVSGKIPELDKKCFDAVGWAAGRASGL